MNRTNVLAMLIVLLLPASVVAKGDEQKSDALLDRIEALEGLVTTLQNHVTTLEGQVATLQGQAHTRYTASEAVADTTIAVNTFIATHASNANAHHVPTTDSDPSGVLSFFSRENGTDIVISGANLHVRNGTGSTSTPNPGEVGLGNVIIGYNEPREAPAENNRSGSHMLVVGSEHNYSSYAGLLVGRNNTVSKPQGTALGVNNTVTGEGGSVIGGVFNEARGSFSSVTGGNLNTAIGGDSSVAGGTNNQAIGGASVVGGGSSSQALGQFSYPDTHTSE